MAQTLPEKVNDYAIVAFRVLILTLSGYLCLSFFLSLREDIAKKYELEMRSLEITSSDCQEKYFRNRCDGQRVPAIRELCLQLD